MQEDTSPSLVWLEPGDPFPPVTQAWGHGSPAPGLLAAGAELDADQLEQAYRQGIFPWYSPGQPVLWWSPEPRMVLEPRAFRLHRSLRQSLRHWLSLPGVELVFDRDFAQVMARCAAQQRPGQNGTWIVPEMVAAWRAGADIVNMKRRSRRDESWAKRRAAGAFYRLINRLSDTPIPADIGDFRLLSRRAVQALNRMPERNRFMKGLFAWIGFPQVTLEYDVAERAAGATKWSPRQLTRFAVEGITAFSIQPLKFATKVGLLTALFAVGLGLFYLVRALLLGDPVPGFPTLIVVILMLGGMQLMAIGLLGEYLGRLWLESKQRPLYIVQDHWPARQFEAPAQEGP